MRIVVEREGRSVPVDVAPGADSVTIDGHSYPVVVVRTTALQVELEIAGEKVVVDNWPEHFDVPPGPVDVNGERWTIRLERGVAPLAAPGSTGTEKSPRGTAPLPPKVAASTGTPILPPMPGKVIELRVKEGDPVAPGDVLLVLEAMKMRNEMTSPVGGVVRGIAVKPGTNARAKEPMMFIAPA
ncbi:MAG TPA: biotin/lipoyl-containing protein [Thermoplasmata archaeon]|nr:biotin/lipoyl-containing protein [Thermoplasmata archaeon]